MVLELDQLILINTNESEFAQYGSNITGCPLLLESVKAEHSSPL